MSWAVLEFSNVVETVFRIDRLTSVPLGSLGGSFAWSTLSRVRLGERAIHMLHSTFLRIASLAGSLLVMLPLTARAFDDSKDQPSRRRPAQAATDRPTAEKSTRQRCEKGSGDEPARGHATQASSPSRPKEPVMAEWPIGDQPQQAATARHPSSRNHRPECHRPVRRHGRHGYGRWHGWHGRWHGWYGRWHGWWYGRRHGRCMGGGMGGGWEVWVVWAVLLARCRQ